MKGIGVIYPDFRFLSKKTGQEIYWEHNGKCDDPAYARNMVKKINAYGNTGKIEQLVISNAQAVCYNDSERCSPKRTVL